MVRDAIVFGTTDHKVREKCITEGSELSLEKAINFARTCELSKAQLKTMESEDKTINMLNKQGPRSSGKKYRKQYTPQWGPPQNNKAQSPNFANKCKNCGGNHERRKCPAFGKQCNKCHQYNHFASVCLSSNKSSKKMHTLDVCSESDDDELFVATIDDQELNTDEWTETINVNDVPVIFQLDTGAKCNVLSLHKLKTICSHPIITKQVSPLRSYSGHIIDTVGVINLRCSYKCQYHAVKFHILDRNVQSVIGAKTCEAMKLLKHIHSISNTSNPQETTKPFLPENMEQQYGDLFTGLGCLPGTHNIRINKTVTPVVQAPRKIIAIKDKVKAELDRMEDIGVIFKQQEPTQWVNSMVTVIKPNGKIRICIDPRDLNKAILREHYPLKTVEDVISQMPNAKVFSKLDATSGFWHIQLDEPSSKLCTFNTPFGRYRFARLPFGINSASEVFQKIVSEMVSDIEGAEAIIDDILIWGSDQKEHDMRLKQVLDRAKLSAGKCEISKPEVTYVGHRLTSEGVKPDPEKIRAVNKSRELRQIGTLSQETVRKVDACSAVSADMLRIINERICEIDSNDAERETARLRDIKMLHTPDQFSVNQMLVQLNQNFLKKMVEASAEFAAKQIELNMLKNCFRNAHFDFAR
ncbi:unnamed protein product [Mytilus coruscus]|uniref:Reverse transcriptase domain-containing protein n=1 Tax=Mytilus coruscus TaxID=42192 RepID=A0A6J8D858_MYTCO|nr:unnamed protein product [Mytilus coruscus]